ncbi:hypothetical protein LTR74_011283 [Friedmanniomyces endolithicus]|nr:hypothetical protein LTR74_011283 [Friedmanniomyces endolithicus]
MPLLTGTGKPRVILGTMTFGPDPAAGARITSLDTYNSILDKFQQQGHSEIDTARVYIGGKQEAFTRDAKWQERGLSVATKWYPHYPQAHKAETVEEMLEKSLSELGTKCVDIFYLHAADRTLPFQEPLRKLDEMHKKGKFVQLGLSNFAAFEVAEVVMLCKANNWVRPTIWQGMYNAITRYRGRVDSGLPAGEMYRKRYFKDATFDALRLIEPVVQKHELTLLETAFRWLTHHSQLNIKDGGSDGVIIGVSSEAQLEQNLKDLEKGPLPEEVLKVLAEAWGVAKVSTAHYWHGEIEYGYNTREALGLDK